MELTISFLKFLLLEARLPRLHLEFVSKLLRYDFFDGSTANSDAVVDEKDLLIPPTTDQLSVTKLLRVIKKAYHHEVCTFHAPL